MNLFLNVLHCRAQLRLAAPILGLVMACAGLGVHPVLSQETHLTISPGAYGATKRVEIELNKTMLVDLPAGAAEVVVSQPSIAAAIMRTRTRALVQGILGGDTNIFFLDDAGRTIAVLDVKVITEPSQVGNALEATLARVIPGSHISVESVTLIGDVNRVVMTGTVLSGDDKDRASLVAEQFAGGANNVANIIEVSGTQQVMLQVTVSEVKRDVAKQFGINLSGTLSVGSTNLSFNNATTTGTNGAAGTFGLGNLQINAAIRALETRGALRILAQPTLTAISGQPAKFLAGGELPYATVDPTTNQRTVIFKPYGVELSFTPVVKSNGIISLQVDTSVSDPQTDGSLTKRQANTSVELGAGTTLAIGGLLQETSRQQINQLPGLGNIPILGALFRSRDFQTQQTELVILVTPYLVQPSPANSITVPTDKSTVASDAETIFLGRLENMYGVAGSGEIRGSIKGSVGFVLD
jgi:pilus assembly protein CpaC